MLHPGGKSLLSALLSSQPASGALLTASLLSPMLMHKTFSVAAPELIFHPSLGSAEQNILSLSSPHKYAVCGDTTDAYCKVHRASVNISCAKSNMHRGNVTYHPRGTYHSPREPFSLHRLFLHRQRIR